MFFVEDVCLFSLKKSRTHIEDTKSSNKIEIVNQPTKYKHLIN